MALHHSTVRRTVLVVDPARKGLHRLDVHFLDARHLGKLEQPVALQLFRRCFVLHIRNRQAVRIPIAPQSGDERGLSDALGAVQHGDVVELDAGAFYPRNSGHECFACNRAGIRRVLRAKVIDEERVDARRLVPGRKPIQVIPDGVISTVVGNLCERQLIVPGGELAVMCVYVGDQLSCVRVAPSGVRPFPREVLPVDLAREFIMTDAREGFIARKNQKQIAESVFQLASFVTRQPLGPVVAVREVFCRPLTAFVEQDRADGVVLDSKLAHCLEARLLVEVGEPVDAHEVEGVQEFAAGGICGMVGVRKLAVVEDDARA